MREMRCSSQYPTGPTAAWRHGGASVHYEQTVRERVHRYTMCKQSWNGCIEAYFQNRFFFTNVLDHHKVLEVVICVIASLRKALGRASFIVSLRKALGRASFIASSHHCARPWACVIHCIIASLRKALGRASFHLGSIICAAFKRSRLDSIPGVSICAAIGVAQRYATVRSIYLTGQESVGVRG